MESASPATASQPAVKPVRRSGVGAVAVVAAVIVVLAVAGWFGWKQWLLQRAKHDVSELVIALNAYAIKFGRPPAGTTAEICAQLAGQNPTHEPVVDSYEMNAAGEFIDPWGTPYRLVSGPLIRAYSCGPNATDEQGGGDDIVSGD